MTSDHSPTITVLIVDDHPMFRSGLRDALQASTSIVCVGECSTASEVLPAIAMHHPDVVLMDIYLPGRSSAQVSGIDLTRKIKEQWPTTEIIMLSGLDRADVVLEALQAGAAGYLSKDANGREIVGAIEQALDGGMPISPSIKGLHKLLRPSPAKANPQADAPPKYLVPVMQLMAQGYMNEEIWLRLKQERGDDYLERKTVRNYVYDIIRWLGAENRRDAINQLRHLGYDKP